jgi:hypothetical protein
MRRRKTMNESRLIEHRKPRVSPESWALLAIVVVALLALVHWQAKGQEYTPYVKGTGVIVEQAEMCFSPDLGQQSVDLLNTWQRLVNELEAYERGGAKMHEEDALLGQYLYENTVCATVAEFYHIVITQDTEGYVLARFDEQYGFTTGTFIVRKQDVILDREL